jgi:hypothetical protein
MKLSATLISVMFLLCVTSTHAGTVTLQYDQENPKMAFAVAKLRRDLQEADYQLAEGPALFCPHVAVSCGAVVGDTHGPQGTAECSPCSRCSLSSKRSRPITASIRIGFMSPASPWADMPPGLCWSIGPTCLPLPFPFAEAVIRPSQKASNIYRSGIFMGLKTKLYQ